MLMYISEFFYYIGEFFINASHCKENVTGMDLANTHDIIFIDVCH